MRADDFPPYITIMVVGHIVIPSFLLCEKLWQPEISTHLLFGYLLLGYLTFLTPAPRKRRRGGLDAPPRVARRRTQ